MITLPFYITTAPETTIDQSISQKAIKEIIHEPFTTQIFAPKIIKVIYCNEDRQTHWVNAADLFEINIFQLANNQEYQKKYHEILKKFIVLEEYIIKNSLNYHCSDYNPWGLTVKYQPGDKININFYEIGNHLFSQAAIKFFELVKNLNFSQQNSEFTKAIINECAHRFSEKFIGLYTLAHLLHYTPKRRLVLPIWDSCYPKANIA